MRCFLQLIAMMAILGCSVGLGTHCGLAQEPQPMSDLFQKLQSDKTANDVVDQVRDLAGSDATARKYLADHLPALIEAGPKRYQPSHPPDSTIQCLAPHGFTQ